MAPMCTPEKAKVVDMLPANNMDEMYYNPHGAPGDEIEESITDCSDLDESDDDEEVKEKMDQLIAIFPDLEKYFDLHGQVGEGTFSTVYVAALRNSDQSQRFAIKHIVPTCHPDRIKFELNCLKEIGGVDNVAGINLCLRNLNNVIFVMPYQQHDYFADYVGEMDWKETQHYMQNLLKAIARVHEFGIIHRDIKPSNFLYDRQNKKFLLVDFGLAQKQPEKKDKYITPTSGKRKRESKSPFQVQLPPQQQQPEVKITYIQFDNSPEMKAAAKQAKQRLSLSMSGATTPKNAETCSCYGRAKICSICMLNPPMQASRAGTPGFRPPEVLLKYAHQTTAVDIWAAGIILLSILSNCSIFFSCPNDIAALLELITIFGHDNINKVAKTFGRYFVCSEKRPQLDLRKICCTCRSRGRLDDLLKTDACAKCTQPKRVCLCKNIPMDHAITDSFPRQVYDLLVRLLDLNPLTRITAKDALQHQFFRL